MLRSGAILTLFLFTALLQACGGGISQNANTRPTASSTRASEPAVRTDVEGLTVLVRVPYETEDVRWKHDDKTLVAVLRFSSADADKLAAEAEKFGRPESVSVDVETWFPEELIAQGEMSGDSALRGHTYAANSFFQEPYSAGKITRIEGGGHFILELTAN